MQISGKRMGTVKAVKDSLKKGGSSLGTYIKNVPADGITVRFLTEPEDWFGYYEYWNEESRSFTPMAVGEVIPDGVKPSFRYLASAVEIESDKVIPLKLAKTAANSLILKYDKFGTMMDRNYELQRHGEGLDTTYDVTPDTPSKLNLAKYETLDLEKILVTARASSLGEDDTNSDSVGNEDAGWTKTPASKGRAPVAADDDDDDDEEDGDDDEIQEEFSLDELREMDTDELKSIASDLGAKVPASANRQTLIKTIIDHQER